MRRLKIAYITTYDVNNVNNWSGIGYFIANTVKKYLGDVEFIGNLNQRRFLENDLKRIYHKILFQKSFRSERTIPLVGQFYAQQVEKQIAGKNFDLIFSPGTIPIAYLKTNIPIVFWTDAIFAGMIDFYPNWSNLCKETIKNGNVIERSALDRCRLAIYSSEWAAQTAVSYYKIDRTKIKVIPFGANIECSRSFDDIREIVNSRSSKKCKLLFLGVDWVRKGGDIALEITKELNKSGLETELTIVGCHTLLSNLYLILLGLWDLSANLQRKG